MINKFRYRKPPVNKDSIARVVQVPPLKDKDVSVTYSACDTTTMTRKDSLKDNKGAKDVVTFSDDLDKETKAKLKELFSQLQFSTETALPPDALRRALAESFFDQQRFQLGFMDDAAECFENMLLRIHTHIAHGEAEDMCNARHCIPHQKFAMTLVEQSICENCGATSEPLSYTQMVHYVSTSTLVYQVRTSKGPSEMFGQLLRKAGSMGDVRVCPSACGAVIQIGRTLMNHPEIVSVGLVWNSERPSLEHIMEVFSSIGTTLRLGDVFNTVVDSRWAETSLHNLVGVVTYYGKHYSTFFFHTKLRVWIYFDDATVREVGPRWDQVVEKCRKGRYQPLLLLYALPDGTPVNTDNAPKQVTPLYTPTAKKTPQSVLRRSVTPSPEKPIIGNTRRAITPNPDGSLNQKPPLPRPHNEYQNLSVIQKNIYGTQQFQDVDEVDGCLIRKDPEYVSRKSLESKVQVNIHRTLSSGSSSGIEGMSIPDHMNIPRRRDSGNWSGDRNSASSSSSTTMENPYLYLVGKVPNGGGSVPGSPTRTKSESSSGSSGVYDAGYDSYSLSSNDSSTMTTLQHLMKAGHLAKIPEDYNNVSNQVSQSCDVLCDEADELLVKSRQLEDEHDLVLALALCNAAATKARAAMNAPYNNPQTLTLARMKHNTCIMRARSLHRRMTQSQNQQNKDNPPEIRHTREGSSGSGRHSRQNSRDKGNHSRQNSRELLVPEKEKHQPQTTKNIEIYATLPKRKGKLETVNIEQDNDYVIYDKPPRESRSIFSRSKNKAKEKRSRSEDRNKMSRDLSIAPEVIIGKDTLKKSKEEKEDKDGKSKKQHKIRRKLLMGGLIKRKNRSMPDLTDATTENDSAAKPVPTTTVDDSKVGLKGNTESHQTNGMSGYLSEGHLEFTGNCANANLERSKLMRKSFHGSAGKILTAAKVPPPPPLRTTSQLSRTKLNSGEVGDEGAGERPKYPLPNEENHYYSNTVQYKYSPGQSQTPVSLPYVSNYANDSYSSSFDEDKTFYNGRNNTVITHADVHQEQIPITPSQYNSNQGDSGVDEVDCLPSFSHGPSLELPPYPSPMGSVVHSRQASEDFPPPPPPLDLSALEEHLPKKSSPPPTPTPGSLLAQLQFKRQEILSLEAENKRIAIESTKPSGGETWLRELQAKQAALKIKKGRNTDGNDDCGIDVVNTQKYLPGERDASKIKSVKDLASKFETPVVPPKLPPPVTRKNSFEAKQSQETFDAIKLDSLNDSKDRDEHERIAPEQIAQEIREVEMLNAAVQKTLNCKVETEELKKSKIMKKKSVSFCDEVILVATADEQEDDSYIPNPILERVLRSAMNNPETATIRQEIMTLRELEHKKQEAQQTPEPIQKAIESPIQHNQQPAHSIDGVTQCNPQTPYVRRNSVDNLLNRQNSGDVGPQQLYSQNPHINGQYNHDNTQCGAEYTHQQNPPYSGAQNQIYGMNTQNHCGSLPNSHHTQIPSFNNQNNAYHGQIVHQNAQTLQYNGHTPHRQSPYQPIPQNSIAHPAYYSRSNSSPVNQQYRNQYPENYCPQYSSSPRNAYPQIRQSTPSPVQTNTYNPQSVYQLPPSPAPSSVGSNYNMYRKAPPNNTYDNYSQYPAYQRVPAPQDYHRPPVPNNYDPQDTNPPQWVPPYHPEQRNEIYQRIPQPQHELETTQYHPQQGKYSPYQQVFPPKQILKKTVSFEPGTKGGAESPTPKAVVTPIIVNNANNSIPTDKTKCNLCRKKMVVSLNLYCTDCEFYMSRFKPRS